MELGEKLSPNLFPDLSPDLFREKFVSDLSPDLSPGLPHEKFVSDLFPRGVVFVSDRDKSLSPDLSPRRGLDKILEQIIVPMRVGDNRVYVRMLSPFMWGTTGLRRNVAPVPGWDNTKRTG